MKKKTVSPTNQKKLEAIAIYLHELRLAEAMSQNELSQTLNLHRNTIIRVENNHNMTILTLLELSDAFDISLSELFKVVE